MEKDPSNKPEIIVKDSIGVLDIVAIILIASKAFGLSNITWAQAFAPLWLPWAIIMWFAILACVVDKVGRPLGWLLWGSVTIAICLTLS